jgi:hypothetical protein
MVACTVFVLTAQFRKKPESLVAATVNGNLRTRQTDPTPSRTPFRQKRIVRRMVKSTLGAAVRLGWQHGSCCDQPPRI